MPITKLQKQKRQDYLGASDIPAILGLDPYKSRADVWLQKTQELLPDKQTEVQARGNFLEHSILNWFEETSGIRITRRGIERRVDDLPILVHADAQTINDKLPVEAKSSVKHEEWGEEGTDQVPDHVLVQVQTQLMAFKKELAYVPALISGYRSMDFKLYEVKIHTSLQEVIAAAASEFWQRYVLGGEKPEEIASEGILKRIVPCLGKIIELDQHWHMKACDWQEIKNKIKELEKTESEIKRELLNIMGDAEVAQSPNGYLIRKLINNKGYTKVIEPYSYVTLSWKKNKIEE